MIYKKNNRSNEWKGGRERDRERGRREGGRETERKIDNNNNGSIKEREK